MEDGIDKITSYLDAHRAQMIALQQALTSRPALGPENDGEGEWDRAEYLEQFLREHGFSDIRHVDAPDPRVKHGKRPNLIVRLPGESSDRTIWFLAHMDVVPPGDLQLWETDPWEAVVKGDRIYGRGTEDNQQGLVSSVFTLLAFRETGVKPRYDVGVILVSDEETGSEYGLGYVLQQARELFRPADLIIVPDAGEPDSTMIEVAEKSILWLRFRTRGKQCHASTPEQGINAFYAASELVVRLRRLYELFPERNDLFSPPISTFEPTKKEANVPNVNTIAGEDVFYLDCRLLPEHPVETVMKAIQEICEEVEQSHSVQISVEPVQVAEAAPPTPADAEVVKKLQKAVKAVYGVEAKPVGIGGGTVAALFRREGLPAAVWSTIEDVCHQPNEYCVISNMVRDAKVFGHLCLQK
ncbi:MAG: M20 family metallo-hydrolase [Calditrichaeota bacterium]|nr:MAG: M20 family metallo-hydrolase [Calditrichota bacterium]